MSTHVTGKIYTILHAVTIHNLGEAAEKEYTGYESKKGWKLNTPNNAVDRPKRGCLMPTPTYETQKAA